MSGNRSAPRRSPLLALALGAAVGLTGGGADPATAAGAAGSGASPRLAAAAVASATATAPLVVPETLTLRAPVAPTAPPGVPISPWQLADPSAGPVAGDVEGDPEAVAAPPSLEVTEALQRLRDDAAALSTTGRRPGLAAVVAMSAALDQVGDPYVWGATGPDAFDCSGLTSWSYARAGVVIPRVSRAQYAAGREPVDVDDLLPGDLVFFATADWDPGVVHHVGMYVGHGLMVAAPRPGLTVRVEPVPAADYVGAVRPVPAREPDVHDAGRGRAVPESATPAVGRPAALPSTAPVGVPTPDAPATGTPSPSGAAAGPVPGTATPTTAPTAAASAPTPVPTPTTAPTATATAAPTAPPPVLPTLTPLVVGPVPVSPVLVSPVVTATLVAVPPPLPREISP